MGKYFISILVIFLWTGSRLSAQQLYMPRNIVNAVKNGTRTDKGIPGKNYWQNEGKYTIRETVDPDSKLVSGTEDIVYENNSPDTLHTLAIRFVNNIHKPTSPRAHAVPEGYLTSGLDIRSFSVNNTAYSVDSRDWGTVETVNLKAPVLPHSSTALTISWDYPLSKVDGREGQIDSSTFYVAYSYPRISVYDDYNGWDMLPHTDGQEFYNDFNDYTLAVKVPANYVVWATGELLNPGEVLQPEIFKRLRNADTSDQLVHIADFREIMDHKVTKQNAWNTWKFSASHITDICFGLSNHYVWDAASAVVDSLTGRRVSIQAAYNDTAVDFHHSIAWAQHAFKYYSSQIPGVPYPFSKMTAFQGHADMEYPMMVNDATTNNFFASQMLQDHEISHSYFPFYMGINETRYAFMDEGWATTFEYLCSLDERNKATADSTYETNRIRRYIEDPSTEEDQPIISMSSQLSGNGYGNNSYGKASLSYLALKDMLGDAIFKKALHFYMDQWHGKHPIPWDYFYAMSAGSGFNLNWFFDNWFFTNDYIDLKLSEVKKADDFYNITIDNVGGFAIPFDLKIVYQDGTTASVHETPLVWFESEAQQHLVLPIAKPIRSLKVETGIFMDATPGDNGWQQ